MPIGKYENFLVKIIDYLLVLKLLKKINYMTVIENYGNVQNT